MKNTDKSKEKFSKVDFENVEFLLIFCRFFHNLELIMFRQSNFLIGLKCFYKNIIIFS